MTRTIVWQKKTMRPTHLLHVLVLGFIVPWANVYGEQASPPSLIVAVRSYPEPGKIVASVVVPEVADIAENAELTLQVTLLAPDEKVLLQSHQTTQVGMREEVILDAAHIAPGEYKIMAVLVGPGSQELLRSQHPVKWPGRSELFRGIRILNNLVWELLNVEATEDTPISGEYGVQLPYDRWLFVRLTLQDGQDDEVKVSLRDSRGVLPLVTHPGFLPGTIEAMRFAKAGRYVIEVTANKGKVKQIVVRAVPEIQHSRYPTSVPYIDQGVRYDWEYLERHVLPHVNTIITSGPSEEEIRHLQDWKERGGKVIVYTGRPGLHGKKELEASPEVCANYWASQAGYTLPFSDGILVDEFYHNEDPAYPAYTEAVRLLNTGFPGKAFYPYAAGRFGKDQGSIPFAKVCIEGGGYPCWEAYIAEWPTLKLALNKLREYPYEHVIPFEEKLPGVTKKLIWVFGVFSFPWPYADGYANVNYNAYLDMQFQFIATHPALFGLGGMHIWRSGYCDEERLRWCARLFRHYALEGNTNRLSADPYMLTHIENPDFVEGLKHWEVSPARENSVFATAQKGFGKFIGRYYRGPDSFLVTRRDPEKPNVVRQVIRNLEPGRLYSVKMFTGDYGAFQSGNSTRELHAVSLQIKGAELLSGPQYRYQQAFPTRERLGNFTEQKPFWLNLHWLVFRATAPTAELVISDWKTPQNPGGPQDQTLLYTYVEVKPYLD